MIFNCFTREKKPEKPPVDPEEDHKDVQKEPKLEETGTPDKKIQVFSKKNKDEIEISTAPLGKQFYRAKTMAKNSEILIYDDIHYEENEENLEKKAWSAAQWRKVLNNDDLENTSTSEMLNSLRFGIPNDLRPEIWEFLCQVKAVKAKHEPDYFEKLADTPNDKYDEQINKDKNRTCTNDPFFRDGGKGQAIFFNICRAYANHDPEIGYVQGMNYIVGTIMCILKPENYEHLHDKKYFHDYKEKWVENAFWIFVFIFQERNYRVIFKDNFPKLLSMMKSFEGRLRDKAPEVYKYLNLVQLDVFLCFHKMFLALLLYNNPLELNQRILDLFFVDQENILFKILIRAVNICKSEILKITETDILTRFLQEDLFNTCYKKCQKKLYIIFPSAESLV